MKPAPFEYHSPATLGEAVKLLGSLENDGVDVKILAGGQSLIPMLALRVARPEALIDLGKLKELDYIREEGNVIAIGAMASKHAAGVSPLIEAKQRLFHDATELVGHRQIRTRGSVGGSFAHADPASEYPAVALVLDMEDVLHMDASGLHVLEQIHKDCRARGIRFIISGIHSQPYAILEKAHQIKVFGESNFKPDLKSAVLEIPD